MKQFKIEIECQHNVITVYTRERTHALAYHKAIQRILKMGYKPIRLYEIKVL